MNQTVLQTKLSMPHVGSLLNRQELLSRLTDYSQHGLTLITAPSGYGKTSLVVDWMNSSKCSYCWLSIDAKNNVASSFWLYVCAGLRRLDKSITKKAELLLENSYIEEYSTVRDALLESLEKLTRKWNRPHQLVMVFDDFHHIDDAKILESFNIFLDYLPDWINVVITSQDLPELKLPARCSKLKANVLLTQDLAFSVNQIESFLKIKLSLDLDEEKIASLFDKTEGWAAAIQLAGLAIKSTGDTSKLNSASSASFHENNFLSEFLFEEVFSRLSTQLKELLVNLSAVEFFTTELSDHINQSDRSQALIQELLDAGLFISVLDAKENWYRLHSLFQGWLRSQLLKSAHSEAIRQRAYEWLKQNGHYDQALDLALELRHYTSAARIFRCLYPSLQNIGHLDCVLKRLGEFPVEIIKEMPYLSIFKSAIDLHFYHYEEAQLYMGYVEQISRKFLQERWLKKGPERTNEIYRVGLENEGDVTFLTSGLKVLRSVVERFNGNVILAKELDQEIRASNQREDQRFLCWAHYGAAADAFNNDEIKQCISKGLVAIDLAKKYDDGACVIAILSWLLPALNFNGQLKLAIKMGEQNLSWLEKRALLNLPTISTIYLVMVGLYMEVNQLEKAWDFYYILLKCLEEFEEPRETVFRKNYTYVQLLNMSGLTSLAFSALEKLNQYQQRHFPKGATSGEFNVLTQLDVTALSALMELKTGNPFPLTQWACQEPSLEKHQCTMRLEYERLIYTAGKMLMGEDMSDYLTQLYVRSEQRGVLMRSIGCLLIPAKMYFGMGNIEEARVYFEKAIVLAAPCQYINLILEGEGKLKPLIELCIKSGIEPEYCQRLLVEIKVIGKRKYKAEPQPKLGNKKLIQTKSIIESESVPKIVELNQSNLVEKLSHREVEVLELLSLGYRNKEISERLNLSISTVKRHLQNIYGKLKVNSRTQALVQFNKLN